MKWLIPFSGFLIISFGVFLFFKSGGHKSVTINESTMPAMILLQKSHLGPYHTTVKSIEAVEKFAKENNIPCTESFGEYLDDPNMVEHERLRSNAGCVLTSQPTNLQLPEGFQIHQTQEQKAIKALFDGSPAIGPYKVYGKVADYMREHRLEAAGAVIEKYTLIDGRMNTEYFFPIK